MKRRHFSAVVSVLLMFVMLLGTACGKEVETLDTIDPNAYIKLGEYKGLTVSAVDVTVSAGDIEETVMNDLEMAAEYTDVKDRAVKVGDIAKIDYVGKKDDVAFEGGTGSYDLEIGSESFIPGFEEGVVGMRPGETKDIPLTFPEDYREESLAGQDVVFTVSLNGIQEKKIPSITDDGVLDKVSERYGQEFETVDDYFDHVRTNLMELREQDAKEAQKSELLQKVFDNTECDLEALPGWLVSKNSAAYLDSIESFASQYGMSLENYLEMMGGTREEFEKQGWEYGQEISKQQLVIRAIAKAENIELKSNEIEDYYKEYAEQYGASVDTLKSSLDEDTLSQYLLSQHVQDFLLENAVIE